MRGSLQLAGLKNKLQMLPAAANNSSLLKQLGEWEVVVVVDSHISSFLVSSASGHKIRGSNGALCKKQSRAPTNASQTTSAARRRVQFYNGKTILVGNKIKRFERGGCVSHVRVRHALA